ncbi:FAD-dependent oxidoreductase [Chloroflexota bacterium]
MKERLPFSKVIRESAREIKVCREADVVVVGGGPGGIGAAIAAARSGADTVLVERYGHLGGMGTGGLVTIIPNMSDIKGKQQIAGICQEWVDRLNAREAADHPKKEDWGATDKELVKYYANRSFFCTRLDRVIYSVHIDAEISKFILNEMVEEAGVKVYLHSWGTEPIMDGNKVKGVIFESKSGRQAILGRVVIDSTGDGDLLPYAGADYETNTPPNFRIANLALCFWVANVDFQRADAFKTTQPDKYSEMMQESIQQGGFGSYFPGRLKDQDSVVWFHNRYPNSSQIDVEELTRIEFEGRKKMMKTFDFFKKYVPGFEHSFIALTAPQLGTRASRRVIGDYMLTEKDMESNAVFDDTIAMFPDLDRGESSIKHPLMYIPYRSLIPRKVDNLLVACRAFSSDPLVQEYFNLIPHCIAFGQAAGTAAALATKNGVGLREVDYRALQDSLVKQGVLLPEVYSTLSKA